MAIDADLAERVRLQLADVKKLTEKEMFGGLAFFAAGNMCCSVGSDGLLVRIRPDLFHDALTRPNVSEVAMGGRTMKGYVRVEHEGLAEDADLGLWLRLGLSYAESLPPKKPVKKKVAKKAAAKKSPARRATAPRKARGVK
jgi:TfoX/Sxy family transcriptional regulator of competence genes